MDKHRNPKIDEYIGKRVRIDLPHGSYQYEHKTPSFSYGYISNKSQYHEV